jgi:hypothetical protein
MLAEFLQFVKKNLADIILVIGVILISLLSFAAGYLAAKQQEKEPIKFEFRDTPYRKGVGETLRFPRVGKQAFAEGERLTWYENSHNWSGCYRSLSGLEIS